MIFCLVQLARSRIGKTTYKRGVDYFKAPEIMDCSSFVKWVFQQINVELPRFTYQQILVGQEVDMNDFQPGDLIFSTAPQNWVMSHCPHGVGHVGLITGQDSVVHCSPRGKGVTEVSIEKFIRKASRYRGARRIL